MAVDARDRVVEIGMPKLSDSMEAATVLAWLKRPGDKVARGEALVEVETDKATIVYEAESDGILESVLVAEGETATLGAPIATIRVAGETSFSPAPTVLEAHAGADPSSQPALTSARAPREKSSRSRATPIARRLARELGIELHAIRGTGPGGRIVGADVHASVGTTSAEPDANSGRGAVTEVPLNATQRTIARRMSESRSTIPDFTLETEISMDAAGRVREDLRVGGYDPVPSYNDLVVRAAALALREFPAINGSYADGKARYFGRINVGIAVATDDALLVPTIFDADEKSIVQIASESRRIATAARDRTLTAAELADGTFTVSNLGMFGIRRFHAVINHPQAAILSVGEVSRRPVVAVDGALEAGLMMEVALSVDHRLVYGADGARFLQRLRDLVEHPTLLVMP